MEKGLFTSQIRRKWSSYNVYSLVFAADMGFGQTKISVRCVIAPSLDEAIAVGMKLCLEHFPGFPWRMILFDSIPNERALQGLINTDFSVEVTPTEKNALMQKIISEKSVQLYEQNVHLFTESEKMFLQEKLSIV